MSEGIDAPLKAFVPLSGVDIDRGWQEIPGGAPGVLQKPLSGALDEEARIGVRTRLIRFMPGAIAPQVFVHAYWEEIYILSGTLISGCSVTGQGGTAQVAPAYACRPPGTPHGPFCAPEGCMFLEIQYFA
jgi:hypothetical protein